MNPIFPYKWLFDALIIAGLVAGVAWGVHAYNAHQQGLGEARERAIWVDKAMVAERQANAERDRLQKGKDDAEKQAAQLRVALGNAAAGAASAGRMFGDTIASVVASSSTATVDANRKYTAALGTVLNECQAAYRGMAEKADGHAADTLMLQRAWPN